MANLKYSRQRESIREFLMTRHDHPTADMVYHHIRQIYPNISLGTVYRNLSLLVNLGSIRENQHRGTDLIVLTPPPLPITTLSAPAAIR